MNNSKKILFLILLVSFCENLFAGITIEDLAGGNLTSFATLKITIGIILGIGGGIYTAIGAIRFFVGNGNNDKEFLLGGLIALLIGVLIINI